MPNLLDLPDELKLEIINHYVGPGDIHSYHFPEYRKEHLDKLLAIRGLAHLVPEATFKHRKVVIQLDNKPGNPPNSSPSVIYYPKGPAKFIRELEIRPYKPWKLDGTGTTEHPTKEPTVQMLRWLRRLASGELGFERLKSLRVVIELKDDMCYGGILWMLRCNPTRPIVLDVEKLEFEILWGHKCKLPFDCRNFRCDTLCEHSCSGWHCNIWRVVSRTIQKRSARC
ncbi:hypothetical protein M011DRAFT_462896 [Sporormia fimetaria CBS 119925]|uniref:Uncharacterized protein n=1 Tax=Sporormia fimetaria CBS 119925 TaxID=1340428 RepID=A0A6A6UWM3_9PLEO|nr:hypothetical protein M011DRAFT_462896 [Sporormia fimetaria CBS 119925]